MLFEEGFRLGKVLLFKEARVWLFEELAAYFMPETIADIIAQNSGHCQQQHEQVDIPGKGVLLDQKARHKQQAITR